MSDDGMIMLAWGLTASTVHFVGLLHAAHAVLHVRSSQGAIAWAISLASFPWVALPLYWVFGRRKFMGYVQARRMGSLRINVLAGDVLRRLADHRAPVDDSAADLRAVGELLTGLPATTGNEVRILVDGGDAFSVMLEAIAAAKSSILVQFFIVHDGRLSNEFRDVLAAKAAEGVPVLFLYDELGSRKLSRRYTRELRQAGIRIVPFNSTRGRGNRFQLNFRNHRKITVIDGRTAFVGGLNLGDEYIGRSRRFKSWRDTHLRLEGPVVQEIQLAFVEDWHWATGELPALAWEPRAAEPGRHCVQALPTGPADALQSCQLLFAAAINAARNRIWIASPYFVPGSAEIAALQLAALRGVDVRVLLPSQPDHRLVYLAGFSFYEEMLGVGVKLYRYLPGFMHQKVMLIDDHLATVGTANLDNRSFHLNFEMTVLVHGQAFAAQVAAFLRDDMDNSSLAKLTDYTERSLLFRLSVRAARLLAPVL